jgi:hypothetical protein
VGTVTKATDAAKGFSTEQDIIITAMDHAVCTAIKIVTSTQRIITGGKPHAFSEVQPGMCIRSDIDLRGQPGKHILDFKIIHGRIASYLKGSYLPASIHNGLVINHQLSFIGVGVAHHVHALVLDFGGRRFGDARHDDGSPMDIDDDNSMASRIAWRAIPPGDAVVAVRGIGTTKGQFLANFLEISMKSGATYQYSGSQDKEKSPHRFSMQAPDGRQVQNIWFLDGTYKGHTWACLPTADEPGAGWGEHIILMSDGDNPASST